MDIQVYYDGSCPICCASSRLIHRLDWFNKAALIDLHQPGKLDKAGITYQKAMSRIQVQSGYSEIYEGIDALVRISSVIPVFWLLVPILWFSGKIGIVGNILSREGIRIANNAIQVMMVAFYSEPTAVTHRDDL